MKVSRKAAACICALMMATSSAAAFGVNAADSEGQAVSASQTAEGSGSVKIGKVTEADGSRLTVALGEFSGKKASAEASDAGESSDTAKKARRFGKDKAQVTDAQSDAETEEGSESAPANKGRKAKSGEAADTDESAAAEEKASGKAGRKHGGKGGHRGKFTENGTTEEVNITDDVAVTRKGESASASDIAVGDIVKLKYDENGSLTEVKVSGKHRHHSKTAESAEAADPANASEESAAT